MRRRLGVVLGTCALLVPSGATAGERDPVERALPASATEERRIYREARRAARRLRGEARRDLRGAVVVTRNLARRGRLRSVRSQAFLILRRNVEWYWRERRAPAAAGTRRSFEGSSAIFQRFSGSGWQLHPLANFGALNGLVMAGRIDQARDLADDLLALLGRRRKARVLEYLFPYLGGRPGWVSGMATATGMQALARLFQRTGDARYRDAAAGMLPIFRMSPPAGVRRRLGDGRTHFLLYSQAPGFLVGNGFAQALIGLADYAAITEDGRAAVVLEQGLGQARAGMRRYDTGAWSRYSVGGGESSLHYHRLFATFLRRLCRRVGERRFCAQARRFRRYESEPVDIGPIRVRRQRRSIAVSFRASKPGTAVIALRRQGRLLESARVALSGRRLTFRLRRPRRSRFSVAIDAVSPTGVRSSRRRDVALP